MRENTRPDQAPGRRPYRRFLMVVLIVSALATAFFAVRGVVQIVYWSDPAHRDQTLEPWMPIGFVARSYGVPREDLAARLGLSSGADRRLTLKDLAERQGRGVDETAREVRAAIEALRAR